MMRRKPAKKARRVARQRGRVPAQTSTIFNNNNNNYANFDNGSGSDGGGAASGIQRPPTCTRIMRRQRHEGRVAQLQTESRCTRATVKVHGTRRVGPEPAQLRVQTLNCRGLGLADASKQEILEPAMRCKPDGMRIPGLAEADISVFTEPQLGSDP